ncbi:Serpin (serine protease inhibitor) [Symmachiella dynata]|uniref:Serpin (Serine protease inhibitor) n=1 Tax=Symmachiella dynata TaxID=2527995 RepID=A0A517ZYG3_9PLAN|nr:serpin family protein [Symmachiella dynata]QDU47524.1 Serpin (serine protease inhibitor) [Symmachiella dynata]
MTFRNFAIAFGFVLLAALVLDQMPGKKQPEHAGHAKQDKDGKIHPFASVGLDENPRDKIVEAALDSKIDLQLKKVPLPEAMGRLESMLGIEVVISDMSLQDEGISPEVPLSVDTKETPARILLKVMLEPVSLDWYVEDGFLKITTLHMCEAIGKIRVYDVADLVGGTSPDKNQAFDFEPLVELLTYTISPDMWEEVGGPGTISEFESAGTALLVIRNSPFVHYEIEGLFSKLRQMRHEGNPFVSRIRPRDLLENKHIQNAAISGKLPRYLDDDPNRDAVVTATNELAFDIYPQLNSDDSRNLIFSPLSVSTALSMAYAGADGETAAELRRVLQVSGNEQAWNDGLRELLRALPTEPGREIELQLANRLFIQRDYPLQQQFLDISRETFGAEPMSVDYHKPSAARRTINDWIAKQTREMIPAAVPADLLTPQTRIVAASAISLIAPWEMPFASLNTKPQNFHTATRDVEVAMMSDDLYTKYADIDNIQILELDYADRALSMLLILEKQPTDGKWLSALQQSLSSKTLKTWEAALKQVMVHVEIPRFRFKSFRNLKAPLEHLGVRQLFEKAGANLARMSSEKPLWMEFLLHQAQIDVDEEGTKAAAATVWGAFGGAAETRPEFRADHPFLFLIRDNRSGAILFLGRVMNPRGAG